MIKCEKCIYYGEEFALPHCGSLVPGEDDGQEYYCLAYPYGIPADIINGAAHDKVRPDQNGSAVYEEALKALIKNGRTL